MRLDLVVSPGARASVAALALLALQACTAAVSDLNGFATDTNLCIPGQEQQARDLQLSLVNLGVHSANFFEATVVRTGGEFLTSRLVIDPLDMGTQDILIPNAIPPSTMTGDTFHLEFYADLNNSRALDPPPTDHTWDRPLSCAGFLEFVHIAEFEDIDRGRAIGGNFTFHLQNIDGSFMGRTLEVHVRANYSGGVPQTVGMYRLGAVPGSDVTLVLDGIVDGGTEHEILYYVDLDGDHVANSSGGDVVCRHVQVGTADGLAVELDLTAERAAGHCALDGLPTLPRTL